MKKYIFTTYILSLILGSLLFNSCTELDLAQEDAASSGNWYQTSDQFRESLNETYREVFWPEDEVYEGMDDDWQRRDALHAIKSGSMSSENTGWTTIYKGVTRVLAVIEELETQSVLTDEEATQFLGEANFLRASFYAYLIAHFGDVPFYEEQISVEESFEIGRTSKDIVKEKIYEYYDSAAANLPVSYNGLEYATKGAAYAMKARIALYMGDYEIAAAAAKNCMDLNEYELYPDYGELFESTTKNSVETIFHIPRSEELNVIRADNVQDFLPRNHGGYAGRNPTWELLASYECVDGLPIDESPLFDPQNPFKNRDPRLLETIAPFGSLVDGDGLDPSSGSNFMDIDYNPHPNAKVVRDYENNLDIRNQDTRSIGAYAAYNGLLFKKGITKDWIDLRTDPDLIVMRYADVLLMYAESKIELNQIDESVLDALNAVRDRAYANSPFENPRITTTDQEELRYKVRNERRAELAFEGRRYMDLIRWRLAEKALTGYTYGLLNVTVDTNINVAPTGPLMDNLVNKDLWFWGQTPEIDEDGLPDFTGLLNAGYCRTLNEIIFPERQYLFPIPEQDILLNPNLTQNPGY
ncbi:RagB/SusD family nutrient uptake outer membrane protein [Formosa sediminum]|uniref:RagB/SusD family nutrient uptake outer membrane protein n=1 Tax=Formosa sediminum TaxID=2594004 RepID=A0A516GUL1_9FLAO|nr:RagB/SusD family nutrient uptake outer membrane protein [Formosa sediminum]QDO95213.1 RagB/SusD family nutrient uptake outer membrane protein [Formosa sediminum]